MSIRPGPRTKGRTVAKEGYTEVERLPRCPDWGGSYWLNSPNGQNMYTHRLFRFPAKFHVPVVQWALESYGRKGSLILDPFTGSGTVQVEALLQGINSVGVDIDPLACLIAQAKSTPVDPRDLRDAFARIQALIAPYMKAHADQEEVAGADITPGLFERESVEVTIPPLPNIFHWFRRYVIIDLARILGAIERAQLEPQVYRFFRACAAATIRRLSNADPDPVSGLEVTKVQAERNRTRTIKVFHKFLAKAEHEMSQMDMMWEFFDKKGVPGVSAHVLRGDITRIEQSLLNVPIARNGFPLVVTSPPYCRSVQYSRRHRLEMFWLGLVRDADQHIELTHSYIGRRYVRVNDWDARSDFGIRFLDDTIRRLDERNPHKARTVHHYFCSMQAVLRTLKNVMTERSTLVCVTGDSVCCGIPIATSHYLTDIAAEHFTIDNRFSYAIRNHHMQYGLWNGDGIKEETVIVLRPR